MKTKSIVCLISGRGSNMAALMQAAVKERWKQVIPASITAVISNRADAAGLELAKAAGIQTTVVSHTSFTEREAFDQALAQSIDAFAPDLVVLAGFMRVLTPGFVNRYSGRLINIHPSLLPLFPGLATHRQALAAGVRVHGATVHFVSSQLDGGPIIAQAVVPVVPGDDEAQLAARVLTQEHRLLPRCVRALLEDRVRLNTKGEVELNQVAASELALFGT